MVAKCLVSNKKIEKVSYLPVMINKQAEPEVLPHSDKRSSEVFDYVEWCCRDQELDTRFSREGDKVVVFDDPFNSQDSFRRECTVMKIIKSGDLCRQVFVLSHDQIFLKRIWDRLATRAAERKCLRLDRVGERNTTIREWDIEETTQPTFVASRRALANYFNSAEGDPRQIVLKLRPTLETYCKNIRPEDFGNDTLGTIVGKIREVGPAHTLFPVLADLDETNEYTRRYHHGDDPSAADEPINDTELQGFVKRTLKVIGCC